MTSPICWTDLTQAEPKLLALERVAMQGGCARSWSNLKADFSRLVDGSEQYDCAYRHLLDLFESNGGRF